MYEQKTCAFKRAFTLNYFLFIKYFKFSYNNKLLIAIKLRYALVIDLWLAKLSTAAHQLLNFYAMALFIDLDFWISIIPWCYHRKNNKV